MIQDINKQGKNNSLSLNNKNLNSIDLKSLLPFITNKDLKEIDLSDNNLTIKSLNSLLKMSKKWKGLKLIKFQNNNMEQDFSLKIIKDFENKGIKILF